MHVIGTIRLRLYLNRAERGGAEGTMENSQQVKYGYGYDPWSKAWIVGELWGAPHGRG